MKAAAIGPFVYFSVARVNDELVLEVLVFKTETDGDRTTQIIIVHIWKYILRVRSFFRLLVLRVVSCVGENESITYLTQRYFRYVR